MSRPYWKARHVDTRALLPAKLERGRAYFVDDEQIIIIDHGLGPVEYGGKPGPQGQPGKPIPSLQGQIDDLARAALQTSVTLKEINERRKNDIENIKRLITEIFEYASNSDNDNASAILSLANLITRQNLQHDKEISILASAMSTLFPAPLKPDGSYTVPQGELITASDGKMYLIEQSYFDSDSGVLVLSFYDKNTVSALATLKEGSLVQADGAAYRVAHLSGNASQGVIQLTMYTA